MGFHRSMHFLILALLLLPLQGFAESSWSLTTDLKLEGVYWTKHYGEDTNITLNRLAVIPTLTGKLTESSRLYFKPNFLWDPQNRSDEERAFFDVGEAYYRLRGESWSFQAGSNVFNWGITDGYNPMDIVNTHQYYDPLRSVKLGVLSLILSHSSEKAEQELIYIPKNRGSILPGINSRWLPRRVYVPRTVDNNVVLLLPDDLRYTYTERKTINDALDDNVGLRMQWHFGAVDLGIIGFDGASSFPIVQPSVTGTVIEISPKIVLQTDPDVVLNSRNYRQQVGGLSWVSSQWNFLFKYATVYSQSIGDDPLLPGWTHENIVGLEKNFNIGSEGLLVAILQYAYIKSEKENDSNISVTEIFRRAWMAGGRFSWGDNWTVTALGLYDSLRYSNFQQYSVGRRFFDAWTLQVSAELISGKDITPLGLYNDNDNYRLSLSRSF
ncbi:hypothetical protein [Bdellovibrio sp. HCB337]|uniref:hypothetical protein n=1 Tax=Bdellovibrio sp. HCB337 TaxID=3394358 RepID=UPI0039A5EEB7